MKEYFTLFRMLNLANIYANRKIKQYKDLAEIHGKKEILRTYINYWERFNEAIFQKQNECPEYGDPSFELISRFEIDIWEAPGETVKQWCYRLSIHGVISLVHGNNFETKEAAEKAAREEMEAYKIRLSK